MGDPGEALDTEEFTQESLRMRELFNSTIPMAVCQRRLAPTAGISASRYIVGDVDPIGIRLKEGVT